MRLEGLLETVLHECELDQQAPLLVGVSGGPDSLCLLDGLARLGFHLIAAHFDHRLRPESGQDAAQVQAAAEKLDAAFVAGSGDVAGYARAERLSLEEAARILRYRFLFEQARCYSAQAVAVGHTADDQVETVLMHLLRGAGLSGLKGMAFRALVPEWEAQIPLVRPLLPFWRAETVAYCQEHGLEPLHDRTNQDMAFFRNRIRRELIPFLETYNPQVRKNLLNTARALAGDEAVVQTAMQTAWEDCLAGQPAGYVVLGQARFLALTEGLQRGVLRRAIASLRPGGGLRDVDFETIQRAIDYARWASRGNIDLVQGLGLEVEAELLIIYQGDLPSNVDWPQIETDEVCLPVPGEVDLGGSWRLSSAWVDPQDLPDFASGNASPWDAWIDADALPGEICLRRARPGERFQPLGMDGHSLKLSDFWINQKLPRRARAAWPLVAAGDYLVWVPGYRLAHPFRIQPGTHRALYLRLFRT